ncbi:MAG: lactonase family protein [Fuerstia sp.]|nr:lactonase family protein [Fuerstiella sp.]
MSIGHLSQVIFVIAGVTLMAQHGVTFAEEPLVFVSSFASGEQGAIHAFRLDKESGTLRLLHRTAGVENPFFMAVSPDHKFLYSIYAPTFGGTEPEQVAAFRLEGRSGKLSPLNRQSTKGTASCYLDVDATGKSVLLANYSTGSVASYSVQPDGSLSEPVSFVQHHGSSVDTARQKEPHAHCFVISPNNRFAYSADLGIDQIVCYALDPATAKLTPNQPSFVRTPLGGGPRHLTFHPNGKFMYVINELKNSVTLFDFVPESGLLTERQTIATLPADFTGTSHTADLKITPNGKYLYGTNRGHDSIAAYRIADDGTLSLLEIKLSLGNGPQNLAITRDGSLLLCANMPGNNVAVFRINTDSGLLTSAGQPVEIPGPSCIRILE